MSKVTEAPQTGWKEKVVDSVTNSTVYKKAATVVVWVQTNIWPIYSLGMIVAAVSMVGAVHEKQALADYMYGSQTSDSVSEAANSGRNSLDEEAQHLVKNEVFTWSRNKFRSEALMADI